MESILGLIRHLLTFGGGILVSKGLIEDAATMETLVGAVVTVVGGAWSIYDKVKNPAPKAPEAPDGQ
jgi:hypothetical protein